MAIAISAPVLPHDTQVVVNLETKLRDQGLDQFFVLSGQNELALGPIAARNCVHHRG
jgi:hypothetical protein